MDKTYCMGCMKKKGDFEVCPHCGWAEGTPPAEEYQLYPHTMLAGRYTIGKVLGSGGFGITYIALDNKLSIPVAIKEYFPSGLLFRVPGKSTITVYGGEQKTQFSYGLERFLDEAKSMARFNSNPNMVSVFDFFEENNTAYIVMEYLEGETLTQHVNKMGGKISWNEAMMLIKPLLDALGTIHSQGLIHRDISPDNIFITKEGKTKLLDFGTARFAMGEKSKSLSVILKPGYAPPEQYSSRGKQGPWTDVYGFAATMYRLITGEAPMDAVDRQMGAALEPPSNLGADIPKAAEDALTRALALEPEKRIQTVGDLRFALLHQPSSASPTIPIMTSPQTEQARSVFAYDPPKKNEKSKIKTRVAKKLLILINVILGLFGAYEIYMSIVYFGFNWRGYIHITLCVLIIIYSVAGTVKFKKLIRTKFFKKSGSIILIINLLYLCMFVLFRLDLITLWMIVFFTLLSIGILVTGSISKRQVYCKAPGNTSNYIEEFLSNKKKEKRKLSKKAWIISSCAIGTTLILILIILLTWGIPTEERDIDYNKFLQYVEEGKIASVQISGDALYTLKEDSQINPEVFPDNYDYLTHIPSIKLFNSDVMAITGATNTSDYGFDITYSSPQQVSSESADERSISYGQFLFYVREGTISRVQISENDLYALTTVSVIDTRIFPTDYDYHTYIPDMEQFNSDVMAITGATNSSEYGFSMTNASTDLNMIVDIPDPEFKEGIIKTLEEMGKPVVGDVITVGDMQKLTELNLENAGIYQLDGIKYAVNLQFLYMNNNFITDISELAQLSYLEMVNLNSNKISDITPLKNLTILASLSLNENSINDITALGNIKNLDAIDLSNNNISNITPLSNMNDLTYLYLYQNNIENISALKDLRALTDLNLGGNNIHDISALSGLTNLTYLDLGRNNIGDINMLQDLANLEVMYLYSNNINDISVLRKLTRIGTLDLYNNNIVDLSPIKDLTELGFLSIDEKTISRNMDILEFLKQRGCTVKTD